MTPEVNLFDDYFGFRKLFSLNIIKMYPQNNIEDTLLHLISMLEHLSADSYWAHKASGVRGALLRYLEMSEFREKSLHSSDELAGQLQQLITMGYFILETAAKEIVIPDEKL
jgi:hypothetical protein